jgi:hypothetical protein
MFTHPPLIDNNHSSETPDLPGLEAIDVIGAGFMGVGLAHALAQSALLTPVDVDLHGPQERARVLQL